MKNYFSISKATKEGFRLAKLTPTGPYVFIDQNNNQSEEFTKALNYSEGLALVQKYKDGALQFRDTDGNLSKPYYMAWEYKNGFACVQTLAKAKEVFGNTNRGSLDKPEVPFQFRDLNGNLSKEFYRAWSYNDGLALVRKTRYSHYQFRDCSGNFSEEFNMANSYSQGLAGVQKYPNGSYCFRDLKGNLSEEYFRVWSYNDGYAIVKKTANGNYQYRDLQGNLSEEFFDANNYHEGFAVVRATDDGPYRYRDTTGRYSEEFDWALGYKNGFAIVKKYGGCSPFQLRDKNGNLSDKKFTTYKQADDARQDIANGIFAFGFTPSFENKSVERAQLFDPAKNSSIHDLYSDRLHDYFQNKISIYDLYAHDIYYNFNDILNFEISKQNQITTVSQLEQVPTNLKYENLSKIAKYMKESALYYKELLKKEKESTKKPQFEDFDENTLI